jgi:hypothetical protein
MASAMASAIAADPETAVVAAVYVGSRAADAPTSVAPTIIASTWVTVNIMIYATVRSLAAGCS